ncbi:hypothetical protein V6Z11_A11G276300 [Gossypium hirsutum]
MPHNQYPIPKLTRDPKSHWPKWPRNFRTLGFFPMRRNQPSLSASVRSSLHQPHLHSPVHLAPRANARPYSTCKKDNPHSSKHEQNSRTTNENGIFNLFSFFLFFLRL